MSKPLHHGTEDVNRSGVPSNPMPEGAPSEDAGPTGGQDAGRPELGKDETKDAELLECGCHTMKGRALVVCLDGTSNQFGKNNTNVVELYHRIIKDKKQLTYYNSGIGTYAKPSWRSIAYWKQVVFNVIDTAIAWNFEEILLRAYRWLSTNYEDGDRIYLFGFSRGAYQVRALAGMIEKVGLILRGNEEQIPFAYELYADHKSEKYEDPTDTRETFNMAARFKETFSRPGIKVHYLGVWDTVSSIGLARSKSLPFTDTCEHFCYMRHALALDERRVKFQPEYARGGESVPNPAQQANPNTSMEPSQGNAGLEGKNKAGVQDKPKSRPRVKEVWFAGSHSDIGGGVKSNAKLNNAAIPAMWMGNEAVAAGLNLNPSRAVWNLDALKEDQPTESLSLAWRALEVYPFKQLSYKDLDSTHRQFHLASPRIIKPGQKIHASVAFAGTKYRPKAKFQKVGSENWDNILGRGGVGSLEWAHALGDLLELDLFDHSDIPTIMSDLNNGQPHTMVGCLEKLAFMARSDEGARAIETSDPKLGILFNLLNDRNSDANARIATYSVLEVLAYHGCRFTDDKISTLFNFLDDENSDAGMKIATHSILKELAHQDNFTDDQISTFFNLLNDKNGDASMKIATCSVLEVLACRSHRFTDDQLGALVNFLDDENSDADMKIVICNVLWELASKGRIFTDDQLSTLLNLLGDQGGNADVKLVTCYVLWSLASRGRIFTDDQLSTLLNLLGDQNGDASMEIATQACSILEVLVREGRCLTDDQFSTLLNLLGNANSNASVKIAICDVLGLIANDDKFTDDQISTFFNRLDNKKNGDASMKIATCGILKVLVEAGRRFTDDQFSTLFNLLGDKNGDARMIIATCSVLKMLARWGNFTNDQISTFFNCLGDKKNGDTSMKIATCSILKVLVEAGRRFTDDQFSTFFNLLSDENSDASVKIAICDVLWALAHAGHIFGDVIAPTIYRLIINSNKELQMAGLKALGGFRLGSIPPKVSATICELVVRMLEGGFWDQHQIAVMALCSCIHEPKFFRGVTKRMNVSNFVDIFRKYLEYNFEAKVSFVRGLVGLIEHGDSPQQAIAQNPRVAPTLVQLFYYRKPVVRQAGLQGVLAFSQNEILRPSMRDTNVIRCLSRLAVEFDTPDVQRDVILAFEALVRDDEIAKKAMAYTGYSGWDQDRGYFPLPERIKRQLESDPRFKSKVDEDTV